MISLQEKERLVKIVNQSRFPHRPELGRAGLCVVTGYFNEKSLLEICNFYSITKEDAQYWWNEFGFDESMAKPVKKRGNKQQEVLYFIKQNIGETLTPAEIAEACEISMPTMYNFISSNIGWFKKVKRGVYEIVDAETERRKARSGG
jgi:N-acetylglutamate synthase-like GNAT family acetyltransferase